MLKTNLLGSNVSESKFDHLKYGTLILTLEIVLVLYVKIIRISYVKQTVQNIWKRSEERNMRQT